MLLSVPAVVSETPIHTAVVLQVAEKEWFQSFVVGSMADFMAYIDEKRRDHVWGDDPEIQVCCATASMHAVHSLLMTRTGAVTASCASLHS